MHISFSCRKDRGIDVTSSYHYDDGDESFKNDTFEREPFIVKFRAENSGGLPSFRHQ